MSSVENNPNFWARRAVTGALVLGLGTGAVLQATREPNREAVDQSIAEEAKNMHELLSSNDSKLPLEVGAVLIHGINIRQTPALLNARGGFKGLVSPEAGNIEQSANDTCYLVPGAVSVQAEGSEWYGFMLPNGGEEVDVTTDLSWINANPETVEDNIVYLGNKNSRVVDYTVQEDGRLVEAETGNLVATATQLDCDSAWETFQARGDVPVSEPNPFS